MSIISAFLRPKQNMVLIGQIGKQGHTLAGSENPLIIPYAVSRRIAGALTAPAIGHITVRGLLRGFGIIRIFPHRI